MDQRPGQRHEGLGEQVPVRGALGQDDGEPQLVEPAVDGTGQERGAAGVEIGPHRCRGGRHARGRVRSRCGQRLPDLRRQRQAEFLAVKVCALGHVLPGPLVLTLRHECLDHDGVAVSVERVPLQRQ